VAAERHEGGWQCEVERHAEENTLIDCHHEVASWVDVISNEFGMDPQASALDAACRAMTWLQEFIPDMQSLVFAHALLRGET